MSWVDLHIHSTYSDGTLSPAALIDLAEKRGLAAIALTDHDTVAGVDELLRHSVGRQVKVLGGIEISAWHNDKSVHILGYGLDHANAQLNSRLAELQEARHDRNCRIFEKLNRLGIKARLEEIDQQENGQIGRPHIARLLVRKKIVHTMHDAFSRFLKSGGSAYVESFRIHAIDAIRLVKAAGGIAMLAHPATIDNRLATINELLHHFRASGLDGVEAYYPAHTAKQTRILLQLAAEHAMLVCGGTDFHGEIRQGAPLGGSPATLRIPISTYEQITAALATS